MSEYYYRPNRRIQPVDPCWILEEYRRSSILDDVLTGYIPDSVYVDRMEEILSGTGFIGVPPEPTKIAPNVYLGTQANAENFDLLERFKIRFVLNCAGIPETLFKSRQSRYKNTGIVYQEIPADDSEYSTVSQYFTRAHNFIESSRLKGNVLIHCTGVSRSGAIALSYLVRAGKRILRATTALKEDRRVVLCHRGFMGELVDFARSMNLLDNDPKAIRAPTYGRRLDQARISSAHLPLFL